MRYRKIYMRYRFFLIYRTVPALIFWYLKKHNFINEKEGCFTGFLNALAIINNGTKTNNYKVTEVKTPQDTPENRTRSNTVERRPTEVNLELIQGMQASLPRSPMALCGLFCGESAQTPPCRLLVQSGVMEKHSLGV